jgi:putative ABC transport system permease protein
MDIRPIISALMRNKVPAFLVILQIAISLAIILNTASIIYFYFDKTYQDSGILDENALFYAQISSARSGTNAQVAEIEQTYRQLIATVPGVSSVADSSQIPFVSDGYYYYLQPAQNTKKPISVTPYSSSGSLLNLFGLHVIEGRDFLEGEAETQALYDKVAYAKHIILTKNLAAALFPQEKKYVGRKLWWGTTKQMVETEIVGIVEQFQMPFVQFKYAENYAVFTPRHVLTNEPKFIIRTTVPQREQVMKAVETALRLAEKIPLNIKVDTIKEERRTYYGEAVTLTWLLLCVCILLVIITACGIVGMTTFWVSQRKKQIGIRRALGASQSDILHYFIVENVLLSVTGIGLGSAVAITFNQQLIKHIDYAKLPISYVLSGAALFLVLGICSAIFPAWRAATISPAVATNGT